MQPDSPALLWDALDAAEGHQDDGDLPGPGTAHYLAAIEATRATVSAEVAAEFEEDIETLARL